VPLSSYTTFRAGGPARYFFDAQSLEDIRRAVVFANGKKLPLFVLGGGSNTLFGDKGFAGVVVRISISGCDFKDNGDNTVTLAAYAGEEWDALVAKAVKHGLYGLENLSLIPGRVGATPIQNIGAYGAEVGSVIEAVEVFNTETLKRETLTALECAFGYRNSIFKKPEGKHFIVIRVFYRLSKEGILNTDYGDVKEHFASSGEAPTLETVRQAVIDIRSHKLPDVTKVGTAGSFFKNPVVSSGQFTALKKRFLELPGFAQDDGVKIPAGWLLDRIGRFKGTRHGGALVSEKQALVIINDGDARASDILSLTDMMSSVIKEKTGITLQPEVVIVY